MKSEDNRSAVIREALRHTEMWLEDLEKHAASAELRTISFSATTTAIATLLVVLAANHANPGVILIGATGCVIATVIALIGALPRLFHIRGHKWEDWKDHVTDGDTLDDVLISQAEENDDRISQNTRQLESAARSLRGAFALFFFSICFIIGGSTSSVF